MGLFESPCIFIKFDENQNEGGFYENNGVRKPINFKLGLFECHSKLILSDYSAYFLAISFAIHHLREVYHNPPPNQENLVIFKFNKGLDSKELVLI